MAGHAWDHLLWWEFPIISDSEIETRGGGEKRHKLVTDLHDHRGEGGDGGEATDGEEAAERLHEGKDVATKLQEENINQSGDLPSGEHGAPQKEEQGEEQQPRWRRHGGKIA